MYAIANEEDSNVLKQAFTVTTNLPPVAAMRCE